MGRTGATTVLNKITWLHNVVYTSAGKPTSYQDMSVPQFVYGYVLVMDSEEADIRVQMASHLKGLMSDAQLYGWHRTRAFHGIWLNQVEQGRCTRFDEEAKMQFCRMLIWHPAHSSPTCTNATMQDLTKDQVEVQPGQLSCSWQAWEQCLLSM